MSTARDDFRVSVLRPVKIDTKTDRRAEMLSDTNLRLAALFPTLDDHELDTLPLLGRWSHAICVFKHLVSPDDLLS